MIHHAKLPMEFWAEAVNNAVYLKNRSPSAALKEQTPYQCMFNSKPDVLNLKVFGCMAYAHIPRDNRKKFDPKSRRTIFVGYPEATKGYKLYVPEIKLLSEAETCCLMKKGSMICKVLQHQAQRIIS